MKKLQLAWLLALACAVWMAGSALAHAKLIKSEPPADAKLSVAPKEVKLWFSEELDTKKSAIKVFNPKNEQVDLKDTKVNLNDRKQMTLTMKLPLDNGVYTVKWQNVSDADGDPSEGEFRFTLQAPLTPTAAPVVPTAAPAVTPAPTSAPATPTSAAATPTAVAIVVTPASAPTTAAPAVATPAPLPTVAASASASGSNGSNLVLPLIIGSLVLLGVGAFVVLRRKT